MQTRSNATSASARKRAISAAESITKAKKKTRVDDSDDGLAGKKNKTKVAKRATKVAK